MPLKRSRIVEGHGRVVVTGGLGFIGSHLVERLASEGERVVVFDNLTNGRLENLRTSVDSRRVEIVEGDIREYNQVERVVSGARIVIHLAAMVSVTESLENPSLATEINVAGTINVLNACVAEKASRLVFASSAAVYGDLRPPLREDMAPSPLSPYGASKAAGESYCKAFSQSYGLETVILRLFNVYGPRSSTGPYSGVMAKFAEAIKKRDPLTIFGGSQTRDFVHVRDAVDAIQLAMKTNKANGDVFNVGTAKPITINHLAALFLHVAGVKKRNVLHQAPRKSDVKHSYADIGKAERELGYTPRVELENGVKGYLSWYLGKRLQS